MRFEPDRTLFTDQLRRRAHLGRGRGAVASFERARFGLGAIAEGAGAVGPSTGTRPAELRGALRLRVGPVALDAGAGGGLDGDVGAPAWRVFARGARRRASLSPMAR